MFSVSALLKTGCRRRVAATYCAGARNMIPSEPEGSVFITVNLGDAAFVVFGQCIAEDST